MCNCIKIKPNNYENMDVVKDKNNIKIQIDKCLVNEILYLRNEHDINTKASCCGHNYTEGFIAVETKDIKKMLDLGYERIINPHYPDAKEFFKPKFI